MKCILFVHSDERVLDGLRRMLAGQRDRWELYFATSGESALEACACLHFDVVVSEIRAAELDGVALLHVLRDRYPESARILMSGKEDLSRAMRAASVAYRVLTRPMQQQELISTIARVCILQESFTTVAMRKVLGRIGGLPSLSRTYTALSAAVRDPESSIDLVAAIIEQDMGMTTKVLQIVNSGFFGLARSMTRISTAVTYLGMETVKNLALATETFSMFVPDPCLPREILESMHRRAERAAMITATLPLGARDGELAVVAALLHEIGGLALASRMPQHLRAAQELTEESGCTGYEAEEILAGVSHAEVGAYLLGLWGMGGQMVEAVAHHHRPRHGAHTGLNVVTAVYLAALMADELVEHPGDTDGAQLREHDRQSLKDLDLWDSYPMYRARALYALEMRRGR